MASCETIHFYQLLGNIYTKLTLEGSTIISSDGFSDIESIYDADSDEFYNCYCCQVLNWANACLFREVIHDDEYVLILGHSFSK